MWEEVVGASLWISVDFQWIGMNYLQVDSHVNLYFPVPKVSLKIRHMYMQGIWNMKPTEGFGCNKAGLENYQFFTAGLEPR